MTILPKKKASKEKNDSESRQNERHGGSRSPPNHSHGAVGAGRSRSRNSPPRWPPPRREEGLLMGHESHVRTSLDRHESLEAASSVSSKRSRHRSSTSPLQGCGGAAAARQFRGARDRRSGSCYYEEEDGAYGGCDRAEGNNSGDEYDTVFSPNGDAEQMERQFEEKLKETKGYTINKMHADGACLFRAVADQVYGDQEMHSIVRNHCMDYMLKNVDFYSQYVTEDFNTYIARKRSDNCHGNHVEMQALSEMYNRNIEIYIYSIEPINTFHGNQQTDNEPIRLSYHRNTHYNSLINPNKATVGVGLGLPSFKPGLADKQLMEEAMKTSDNYHIEQAMFKDKLRATDWEATDELLEQHVARESYLQWLKDNEKQSRRQTATSVYGSGSSSADSGWWTATAAAAAVGGGPVSPRDPGTMGAVPPHGTPRHPNSLPGSPHREDLNPDGVAANKDYSGWDDEAILASVLASSQQEYFDSLKRSSPGTNRDNEASGSGCS